MSTHCTYFNKQKISDLALSVLNLFEALGASFFCYISIKSNFQNSPLNLHGNEIEEKTYIYQYNLGKVR